MEIRSNRFIGNDMGLECTGDVVPEQIAQNSWIDTKGWSIKNGTVLSVNATDNWWNAVDENRIAEQFLGTVNWKPFLEVDPNTDPTLIPHGEHASGADHQQNATSASLRLGQSRPNPFTDATVINFNLPESPGDYPVVLTLYNILGQQVRMFEQKIPPGFHEVVWDGMDTSGRKVASGVYWVRLSWGTSERYQKLVFLRP
jgi:hypothetical protein